MQKLEVVDFAPEEPGIQAYAAISESLTAKRNMLRFRNTSIRKLAEDRFLRLVGLK